MEKRPLYLDWNATTPLHDEVWEVMSYYFREEYGNSGSRTHIYGSKAKKAVNHAREQIASVVECLPNEVIFTSGATESNNIAILGLEAFGRETSKMHIISSPIEHKSVLEPLKEMARRGFNVEYLPMDSSGRVNPEDLANSIRPDTLLVSLMQVNNETGVRQPIKECTKMLGSYEAFFHVDAAQGFAKDIPPLNNERIDFISASSHKVQGPKGIGALITRKRRYKRAPLKPLLYGGGQEISLRPGTLAVPLIAGFGKAAELNQLNNSEWWSEKEATRQMIRNQIEKEFQIVGDEKFIMPNCFSLIFENWDSEAYILKQKDHWALSNGSACTSANIEPSHVLTAMGYDTKKGAVRFSW